MICQADKIGYRYLEVTNLEPNNGLDGGKIFHFTKQVLPLRFIPPCPSSSLRYSTFRASSWLLPGVP